MGHEAAIHLDLAVLQAMRGAFDAARESISNARALFQELGVTHGLAGMTERRGRRGAACWECRRRGAGTQERL